MWLVTLTLIGGLFTIIIILLFVYIINEQTVKSTMALNGFLDFFQKGKVWESFSVKNNTALN